MAREFEEGIERAGLRRELIRRQPSRDHAGDAESALFRFSPRKINSEGFRLGMAHDFPGLVRNLATLVAIHPE